MAAFLNFAGAWFTNVARPRHGIVDAKFHATGVWPHTRCHYLELITLVLRHALFLPLHYRRYHGAVIAIPARYLHWEGLQKMYAWSFSPIIVWPSDFC